MHERELHPGEIPPGPGMRPEMRAAKNELRREALARFVQEAQTAESPEAALGLLEEDTRIKVVDMVRWRAFIGELKSAGANQAEVYSALMRFPEFTRLPQQKISYFQVLDRWKDGPRKNADSATLQNDTSQNNG